jgi:hypothetical protein
MRVLITLFIFLYAFTAGADPLCWSGNEASTPRFVKQVEAGTTVIHNNVTTSVNTGGDSASGGSGGENGGVIEGEATCSSSVTTVINGEVTESASDTCGENNTVESHSSITTDSIFVHIETNTAAPALEEPDKTILPAFPENIFSSTETSDKESEENFFGNTTNSEDVYTKNASTSTKIQTENVLPAREFSLFKIVSNFLKNVFSWFTRR